MSTKGTDATRVAHTPGPWVVRIGSTCSGAWPEVVPASADEFDDGLAQLGTAYVFDSDRLGHGILAVTYNERPDCFIPREGHEEQLANARLIAAAPDLLGVAKTADHTLGTIAEYLVLDSSDESLELRESIAWLTGLLRAAITRATEG
jgi:hypothetical protein